MAAIFMSEMVLENRKHPRKVMIWYQISDQMFPVLS